MGALTGFKKSRHRIFAGFVPRMIAANEGNGPLLGSYCLGFSGHAHNFIAHRASGEIINPRQALHELPRPGCSRAGTLAKLKHCAIGGELKRLGSRHVKRISQALEISFSLRFCSKRKRQHRERKK